MQEAFSTDFLTLGDSLSKQFILRHVAFCEDLKYRKIRRFKHQYHKILGPPLE